MKRQLLMGAAVAVAFATPAFAGFGGTHVSTDTQHHTVTENHNRTRVHTVRRPHEVEDVTVHREITRVHPVHHVTDVDRVLHHQKVENSDENVTHRHVAPARVEHTNATEQYGALEHGRVHVETTYHDVYRPDYRTVVHERDGSPAIMHEIHRHINEITVQPVIHERDVTRVENYSVHHNRNEVEHREVVGAARTIVTHKREDVDP